MTWYIVLLDTVPRLVTLQTEPKKSVTVDGRLFSGLQQPDTTEVFNDVLVDDMNSLLAIELHIIPADPVYAVLNQDRVLESNRFIEHAPFTRIWFSDDRSGHPLGLEAFGNLRLFRDQNGIPAIAFNWRQFWK